MSPITHLLMGWILANTAPSLPKRDRALITLGSVIPDLDGIGIVVEVATRNLDHPLTWWSDFHHVLGHNLGFALVVSTVASIFAVQKLKTTLLVLASFHLHLLADLMGARGPDGDQWPIPYLLPFSNRAQWIWSGQWALNAWPNLILTASLLLVSTLLARRRGFSPLELLSPSADSAFVAALRSRFPVKITNGSGRNS